MGRAARSFDAALLAARYELLYDAPCIRSDRFRF
jgi:hypothetical protein